MKVKKLLSTFAALAIAASSFAGLGISANAAITTVVNNAYTDDAIGDVATTDIVWTKTAGHALVSDNTSGVRPVTHASCPFAVKEGKFLYLSADNGNITASGVIANSITTTGANVNFDFCLPGHFNGSNRWRANGASKFKLQDDLGNEIAGFSVDSWTSTGGGTKMVVPTAAQLSVGDQILSLDTAARVTGWINANFQINTDNVIVTLTPSDTDVAPVTATIEKTAGLGNLNKLVFESTAIGWSNIAIDNLIVKSLDAPAFTLSAYTASVNSTDTTANIAVSDITGTISVKSSDENVVTAVYAGDTVTITRVGDGTANVTVTAENDGVSVSKVIAVESGDIVKKDVTVNYYKTGTTTSVKTSDTTTFVQQVVGTQITVEQIDTETVTDASARYVYNASASGATALPYTVVDGVNVINVYFDEQPAVASYTVSYTGITKATDTVTLTGKYVGDAYSYTPNKYLKDDEGKWWTTSVTEQKGTLAADTALTVTYTAAAEENIVSFVEAEDLENSYAAEAAGYSGGKYAHVNSGKTASIGTLPAGKYTMEISLKSDGNRGVYLRNAAGNSVIITAPIDKNSAAGVYTTDEFSITETTSVVISGYTNSNDAINQSAEIDYVLIRKTGTVPVVTVELDKTEIVPDTNVTPVDGGAAVSYAELKGEKVATMVYIKVVDPETNVTPIVTLDINGVEETAQATYFKAPNETTGYFIYQILSSPKATVKSVTYNGVTAYTAPAE